MSNDNEIAEVESVQREPEREQRVFTFTESKAKHPATFLGGLILGSLASAVALLLFAPQSGKKTRQQIQQKANEIYDQTASTVEGAVNRVRSMTGQVKTNASHKARVLKQQGQDAVIEQLDRVSAAAKTGKKAIQGKPG
jgi:gas vesicle protein